MTEEKATPMKKSEYEERFPSDDLNKHLVADTRDELEEKMAELRMVGYSCVETRLINKEDDEDFFLAAKMVKTARPQKDTGDKIYIPED